ncbi:hypothetical protein Purlil1_12354 [Purpureocillium lilacinum]|uniref:Uncharacterized protein n=1 Tax=Purpureocillium lilacinum TaxID=33203 RepID=A0ABR0BI79_PURLI|nr:hypothetical protein Purlil1_12354 [Purpureocillium lilacinum]
MLAAAGAAAAAVGIYRSRQGKAAESQDGPSRNPAHTRRDLGLGGAGVGGNQVVGSTELGASHGRPDKDPEAKTGTTASPSELPSGGVGGGEERVRHNGRPRKQRVVSRVIGLYGTTRGLGNVIGGVWPRREELADKAEDSVVHNTRDISKMGSEVPSKKRVPKASD